MTDPDAGTPDVVIDLSQLLGVSNTTGNILVNGTDGKPLLTCDLIKAQCTTQCTSVFGTPVFNAFAP